MNNYSAVVVKIDNLRKHSNADRLMCTNIFGNNVIVGLDTKEGDVGLFFPVESQLGQEFAEVNDLIRRRDENGKPAGGMFDSNRRVRAQKFRGEYSMGFFAPIEYLSKLTGIKEEDVVTVGDELDLYHGWIIATKYEVPKKNGPLGKSGRKAKESRVVPEQFHFHFDTAQLYRNLDKIDPLDFISITWKFHGTSGITGHVLCNRELKWYEKIAKKLGVRVVESDYDYIYASRRVIKNDDKEYNHFYDIDIWSVVGENFKGKLHKGETVYYEIVGFLPDGGYIQSGFDYGCDPGCLDVYVYRITNTNVDGIVTELSWDKVKTRSLELGMKHVPEVWNGYAKDIFDIYTNAEHPGSASIVNHFGDTFLEYLKESFVYDQDSVFCKNKVPEEGIVIRVERPNGIESFKLKSQRFYEYETEQLDKGEGDIEQ